MNVDDDTTNLVEGEATLALEGANGTPIEIGPYRLVQRIGAGGMGEVWEASQAKPVRRRVALKLIKAGMDTKAIVTRFEAERQALAMMDHSAIARVFDAGATPEGRPYFVMELVQGEPICSFCDRHRLTTRERLELFIRVCEGVQHAHQKAIIHRDLKPSNILVAEQDGVPVPKIIDFGVAKATSSRLTEETLLTLKGMLIGTPEYMSPEQAAGTLEDVDTRTDVYALGAVLYELLVGAAVFDQKIRQAGYDEMRRRIREEEPLRPSTRISSLGDTSTGIAQSRRTEPRHLSRQLRGDLDWIVMKALEKERQRRYGSPMELAADIKRHLAREPVLAGPPSPLYKAKKFVARHKLGIAVAGLVSVGVIAFATMTFVQSRRVAAERDRANVEAETATRVSDFLLGLFEVVDPSEARGSTITAREILDSGADRISRELSGQPAVQARMMRTIGRVYESLGLYDSSASLLEQSLAISQDKLGELHPETAAIELSLASLLDNRGEYEAAEERARQALAHNQELFGETDARVAESHETLALILANKASYDEALEELRRALSIRQALDGRESGTYAHSLQLLGSVLNYQGHFDEAESTLLDALEIKRQVYESPHPEIADCLNELGVVMMSKADFDAAEKWTLEYVAMAEELFPEGHPQIAVALENLGAAYYQQRQFDRTFELLDRVLEMRRSMLGEKHTFVARTLANMGTVYSQAGRLDEAEGRFRESLAILEKTLGENHPDVGMTFLNLGVLQHKQKNFLAAESSHRRAIEIFRSSLGEAHANVAMALYQLGLVQSGAGEWAAAEESLRQALAIHLTALGEQNIRTANDRLDLGTLLLKRDRYEEAEPILLAARSQLEQLVDVEHDSWQRVNRALADLYRALRQPDTAAKYAVEEEPL